MTAARGRGAPRAPSPAHGQGPVLVLGETIVDLVREPGSGGAESDSFVPHLGGGPTNVSVVAARCGAPVALAGGAGDDLWGRWLAERLRREGVDLRFWSLVPGARTAVAFVVVDRDGVPGFLIYGEGIEPAVLSVGRVLEEAVRACSALVLGSNTMVGAEERRLCLRARDLALASGKPVLWDANLRLHRWPDPQAALELARSLCSGAFLVKVNAEEARLLTGRRHPRRAAEALHALGARVALVTLGAGGALLCGDVDASLPAEPASVVDTTGAGDALLGVLVAALSDAAFDPSALVAALPAAVAVAARSTEAFGALGALPERIELALGRPLRRAR
ncbi:MAG TPA: PfkB family carbohydrate kinase [Gaiellaceae bacterium]|nr:PfkB family carbohydrate kinase [Gaiellaceae bacterium]